MKRFEGTADFVGVVGPEGVKEENVDIGSFGGFEGLSSDEGFSSTVVWRKA